MKRSPFPQRYWNAELFIERFTEQLVQDEDGNWTPEIQEQRFWAILEPPKSSSITFSPTLPTAHLQPGQDRVSSELEGWLTDPMWFPAALELPKECRVRLRRAGGWITGVFQFKPLLEEPWQIDPITGTRIAGTFWRSR